MCVHDLDGVLLFVNPAVGQSLGYSIEEGIGRNLGDFLAPSVRHRFSGYLERIRNNPVDTGLMLLRAKDGTDRTWFYRNLRYDQTGSPSRVLGHAIDITSRVETERALKAAERALSKAHDELAARVDERTAELQLANERLREEIKQRSQVEEELLRSRKLESLGVLAGGIAHDFNNFITIVQGHLALAQKHLKPGDDVYANLEQASRACQRATTLASQLLTFGKGGAPVRRTMAVGRLIRDAVDLVRAGAEFSLELSIADDLLPAEIDPEQISRALHNILLNARQAMPHGGIIEVHAENVAYETGPLPLSPGNYVRISVRDYGCGISPDLLPRVFDPYFTTKAGGSGLGLATTHAIVAKHQGHVTVQSTLGVETTFSIYLPASGQNLPADAPVDESLQQGSGRILVMDDEEQLRLLLSATLEELGYEVTGARDGAEAIALAEQARASGRGFDAVLLDLTVPGGMGGVEAAAKLREVDPSAQLIVSSGYSDAPVLSEFQAYGFVDVIPKPWTPAALSLVLRRVLVTDSEQARA